MMDRRRLPRRHRPQARRRTLHRSFLRRPFSPRRLRPRLLPSPRQTPTRVMQRHGAACRPARKTGVLAVPPPCSTAQASHHRARAVRCLSPTARRALQALYRRRQDLASRDVSRGHDHRIRAWRGVGKEKVHFFLTSTIRPENPALAPAGHTDNARSSRASTCAGAGASAPPVHYNWRHPHELSGECDPKDGNPDYSCRPMASSRRPAFRCMAQSPVLELADRSSFRPCRGLASAPP